MRKKTYVLALLSVLALFATSCASNKDTGFPKITPTPSASESAGEDGPVKLTGPIDVADNKFVPEQAEVSPGTEIAWEVSGSAPHSITFDDGSYDVPKGCAGPTVNKCTPGGGKSFTFKITKPGKYHYYCRIHGGAKLDTGMYGYIIVK